MFTITGTVNSNYQNS